MHAGITSPQMVKQYLVMNEASLLEIADILRPQDIVDGKKI